MAYSGLSGQYGTIPDDVWLRKNEVTNLGQEDPQMMENHLRNLLVDRRPDTPFLESDQPRSSNIPGSGFMSEQRLNLRHEMALTTTTPYLPDGTFLDHVFMERDPRSTAIEPDMRKYVDQEKARGSFYKYSSDESWNIPESGINPVQMIANINSGFYPTKDRKQIFDESFDNFHNGGVFKRVKESSGREHTTNDGTIIDLADASYVNRKDAVSKLSDDPTIAYRHSIPDHRFKIARYGIKKASQSLKTQDWKVNRAAAYVDRSIGVLVDNERINKDLANVIINLKGIKDTKQKVYQGASYGDSETVQNLQSKVPTEVLNHILQYAQNSQNDPANVQFESSYTPSMNAKRKQDIKQDYNKSEYNHFIIESMISANNKQMSNKELNDLREKIKQSASDYGLYLQDSNKKSGKKTNKLKQIHEKQEDDNYKENSKSIANYKHAKIKKENKLNNVNPEHYKSESNENKNKKQKIIDTGLNQKIESFGETVLYEEKNAVHSQSKGRMKNKEAIRNNYDNGDELTLEKDMISRVGL
jgi:hypothetical protein